MARIRTIKPEFYQDEDLAQVSEPAFILAAGLLNHADDEGYFKAHHGLIKAAVFPLREPSVSIHEMLIELSDVGYIRLFEGSDRKQYGVIVNFLQHQRVNRPTPSRIRQLDTLTEDSVSLHGQLITGKERKGKEGKGVRRGAPARAVPDGLQSVLPEDWELPDEWRRQGEAVLVKCGCAPGEVNLDAEAIAFHGHYRSEQKTSGDFCALWRKWLVTAAGRARKDGARPARGGPAERPPSKPFPFLPGQRGGQS